MMRWDGRIARVERGRTRCCTPTQGCTDSPRSSCCVSLPRLTAVPPCAGEQQIVIWWFPVNLLVLRENPAWATAARPGVVEGRRARGPAWSAVCSSRGDRISAMTFRTGKTRLAVQIISDGIGYAMPIPFFFLLHLVPSQRAMSARCGVLVAGVLVAGVLRASIPDPPKTFELSVLGDSPTTW